MALNKRLCLLGPGWLTVARVTARVSASGARGQAVAVASGSEQPPSRKPWLGQHGFQLSLSHHFL